MGTRESEEGGRTRQLEVVARAQGVWRIAGARGSGFCDGAQAWVTAGEGCDVRAASRMRGGGADAGSLAAARLRAFTPSRYTPLTVASSRQSASFFNTACRVVGMCNLALIQATLRKAFLTFNPFKQEYSKFPTPCLARYHCPHQGT